MKIKFSDESDVGMHRVANEDAFVVEFLIKTGKWSCA